MTESESSDTNSSDGTLTDYTSCEQKRKVLGIMRSEKRRGRDESRTRGTGPSDLMPSTTRIIIRHIVTILGILFFPSAYFSNVNGHVTLGRLSQLAIQGAVILWVLLGLILAGCLIYYGIGMCWTKFSSYRRTRSRNRPFLRPGSSTHKAERGTLAHEGSSNDSEGTRSRKLQSKLDEKLAHQMQMEFDATSPGEFQGNEGSKPRFDYAWEYYANLDRQCQASKSTSRRRRHSVIEHSSQQMKNWNINVPTGFSFGSTNFEPSPLFSTNASVESSQAGDSTEQPETNTPVLESCEYESISNIMDTPVPWGLDATHPRLSEGYGPGTSGLFSREPKKETDSSTEVSSEVLRPRIMNVPADVASDDTTWTDEFSSESSSRTKSPRKRPALRSSQSEDVSSNDVKFSDDESSTKLPKCKDNSSSSDNLIQSHSDTDSPYSPKVSPMASSEDTDE